MFDANLRMCLYIVLWKYRLTRYYKPLVKLYRIWSNMIKNKMLITCSLLFIALVYADIITTIYGVNHGLTESNPMCKGELSLNLIGKLTLTHSLPILLWITNEIAKRNKIKSCQSIIKIIILIVCLWYLCIFLWNITLIIRYT